MTHYAYSDEKILLQGVPDTDLEMVLGVLSTLAYKQIGHTKVAAAR